jgi:Cdc6-like AAA superfamily ATPase
LKNGNAQYNPLGNLSLCEVGACYVWSPHTLLFLKNIRNKTNKFYCIKGREGTGKTTLLQSLFCQLDDCIYISFKKADVFNPFNIKEQILIVDRIYNLSLLQRLKLWACKKTIVYSAHYDIYSLEQIRLGQKKTIKLGPKKPVELQEIIGNRLSLANLSFVDFEHVFSEENIRKISSKHSGNPRGVINELYFKI